MLGMAGADKKNASAAQTCGRHVNGTLECHNLSRHFRFQASDPFAKCQSGDC
jgi:hypothetical protein